MSYACLGLLWHPSCCFAVVLNHSYHRASLQKPALYREGMRLNPAERRRSPRIRLQVPMFVRGVDASGTDFLEVTKTLNISATGAFLASPRMLGADHVLNLTIPAPPLSGSGLVPPETPPIQARIRRQQRAGDLHLVGIEFLRALD